MFGVFVLDEQYLVGICTTGSRPTLQTFLDKFQPVLASYPGQVRVVISVNGGGDFIAPSQPQVHVVYEPRKGIAFARNRILQERHPDENLIFIDDDEYPDDMWFANLIECHKKFPNALIAGPVREVTETGEVVTHSKIRPVDQIADGAARKLAATNNLLFPVSVFETGLVYLDLFFNHGGSDTDLSMRLQNRGVEIRWAANAVMYELEDADRSDPEWSYRRDCRNAAIYPIAVKRNARLSFLLAYSLKKFLQLGVYSVLRFFGDTYQRRYKLHKISVKSLILGRQAN